MTAVGAVGETVAVCCCVPFLIAVVKTSEQTQAV